MNQPMSGDLRGIPGVGESIAWELNDLGLLRVEQLRGQDAEALHARMMAEQGTDFQRCALYVVRFAIYFAEGGLEPERLLWRNWKDRRKAG